MLVVPVALLVVIAVSQTQKVGVCPSQTERETMKIRYEIYRRGEWCELDTIINGDRHSDHLRRGDITEADVKAIHSTEYPGHEYGGTDWFVSAEDVFFIEN